MYMYILIESKIQFTEFERIYIYICDIYFIDLHIKLLKKKKIHIKIYTNKKFNNVVSTNIRSSVSMTSFDFCRENKCTNSFQSFHFIYYQKLCNSFLHTCVFVSGWWFSAGETLFLL